MAENQSKESEESKRHRSVEQSGSSEHEPGVATDATSAYVPSLLSDPAISRRGNTPVRSANLHGMQQTHGNRAVQRFLHGATVPSEETTRHRQEVGPEGGLLPDELARRVDIMRGAGVPLNGDTQQEMESAFGESLHDVRLHTGEEADDLNQRIGARAFTTGSDIFFRDEADPGDSRLLAHELTHVIQQRGAPPSGPLSVGPADDSHEQEAHSAADSVTTGAQAQVHTSSGPAVARDLFDNWKVGDWKIKPTFSGSTDDRYDSAENKRRAEMKDADKRSNDPSPPKWWEKPKYDPSAPLPWMPKSTSPGGTVAPPASPDQGQSEDPYGPGDFPESSEDEDEQYA